MNILAIDTSSSAGSVALRIGDSEALVRSGDEGEHYATRLFRWLEEIKEESGLENGFLDLDAVAVAAGPGTFTGLRVGVAAAKGIALTAGKPVLSFPTLAAMCIAASGGPALRRPLLPAGRGEIYTALYRLDGEVLTQLNKEIVVPPDGVKLVDVAEPVLLFGAGVALLDQDELAAAPDEIVVDPVQPVLAPALLGMAAQRLSENPSVMGTRVDINYIREAAS
jgi:tRNA threonylcarbamoyladenosine biosynthesis protein TsaB